ncbi:hypothetical protein HYW55_01170 [Candidatus Gottesmanbacteria bacterium]|nr:hypothetical protein [Candidatus Gottesmanbacteria bacterium]
MRKSKIFITVITFIIGITFIKEFALAQKSLQFSSFTPEVTVPPGGNNAECRIALAEETINRYKAKNLTDYLDTTSISLLSCDIYRYIRGCTSSTDEDCTSPCIYIKNGPTAEQIQSYPGVRENVDYFHTAGTTIYPPSYLYTKAVGRFDLRNGFGLTEAGKQEAMATLLAMTCAERAQELTHHVSTPLYFYPLQKRELSVTLPDATSYTLNVSPDGIFTHQGKTYSSLSYELRGISLSFQPEGQKRLLDGANVELELRNIAEELSFTQKEREDFVAYWAKELPRSPYFEVTLLSQDDAQSVAPWSVLPVPTSSIRYIFAFRPLVDKKVIANDTFTPLPREGFTAVDIGGIIIW